MASNVFVVKLKWDHFESTHQGCYLFVLLILSLPRRVEDIIGMILQLVSGSTLLVVTCKLVTCLPIGSYPSILSVCIVCVCVCACVCVCVCVCVSVCVCVCLSEFIITSFTSLFCDGFQLHYCVIAHFYS